VSLPERAELDALEAQLLASMVASRLPGMVLLLLADGEVVHRRALGFRDLATRAPTSADTLFGIGSITKVFTALATMQLVEAGRIDLDDPVGAHLDLDLRVRDEPVTIRHLLSHSSGVPALGYSESKMSERWFMDGYPVAGLADLFTFLHGAADWAVARPGERWLYLNEGYLLLGALLEKLHGLPYPELIRERLLTPLGMTRSHFERDAVERDLDRATPYMMGRDGELFIGANLHSAMPAAGGLVCSAEDLARLASALLNSGRSAEGAAIVSPDTLARMQTPQVDLPLQPVALFEDAPPPGSDRFGLGLQLQQGFFGHTVVGHGGGVMGGTGYLALIPERGLGAVLLANGHGTPLRQLAFMALATLLGHDPERLPFRRLGRLLDELCGSYTAFRGTIAAEVARRGDLLELTLRFAHEDRRTLLTPVSMHAGGARFRATTSGREQTVEVITTPGAPPTLVFERYAFRKRDRHDST
jgi:CubicO group peptidase (beta-lactamase class C family)